MYDTSTDPIIDQYCDTSYFDDGSTGGPPDTGGGGGGSGDPSTVEYREPWGNFDTSSEKACKRAGVKFISVSKNAGGGNGVPAPGETKCGPKTSDPIELTAGLMFPYPGDCPFIVHITSGDISVEYPNQESLSQGNSGSDGIRINADCSFDFVRF